MKVLIIQTSDGERYKPMLDITQPIHTHYCKRYGYEYKRFDGIKRGFKPWHAAFNRVYMVLEEIEKGEFDWILHMDADAVVVNPDKSLAEFLDNRYALVACRGSTDDPNITWNVNNGVMFYNLRHKDTKEIMQLWKKCYESITDEFLKNEAEGVFNDCSKHVNDQDMICLILFQERFRGAAKIYRGDEHDKFNYSGPFIRQVLRTADNTTEERIQEIRTMVESVEKKMPRISSISKIKKGGEAVVKRLL